MRQFARLFTVLGLSLTGLSAWAISDPSSPVGWDDWRADPWSRGLIAGPALLIAGSLLGIISRRVSRRADFLGSRIVATLLGAGAGFLLFAPFVVVTECDAASTAAGCRTRGWSNVLGLAFEGQPSFLLSIAAALLSGFTVWVLVGIHARAYSPERKAPH